MQFLYCMIDTMGAINKCSVYHVLDATEKYFRKLDEERARVNNESCDKPCDA